LLHIEAVRKTYGHVTDNDIGESISKWLAQATLRIQRAKYVYLYNYIYIYIYIYICIYILIIMIFYFYLI